MPVQPFGGDLVISNKIVYTLTFWPDNLTYSGAVSPMVCKSACKQLFQHHLYMWNTWNHLCVRVDEEFPLWLSGLRTSSVSVRMWVQSPAFLSGLRIWRCRKLCSQMWLGSDIAMPVVEASCCSCNLKLSPGISICCKCSPKKTNKQTNKQMNKQTKNSGWIHMVYPHCEELYSCFKKIDEKDLYWLLSTHFQDIVVSEKARSKRLS